jgi:UDP:flavonoid glycosyltransferase YjiC (YdhE family)
MTIGNHGDVADLGPLPANAIVERWVPQADVAAHAVAMVCHGGYGTTVGALSAGAPLVVAPLFADQGWNAARVEEIGAGLALPMAASIQAADVTGLGELVRRVLAEPSFGRAAGEVAASAQALPSVDAAPDVLAAIAGRRLAA